MPLPPAVLPGQIAHYGAAHGVFWLSTRGPDLLRTADRLQLEGVLGGAQVDLRRTGARTDDGTDRRTRRHLRTVHDLPAHPRYPVLQGQDAVQDEHRGDRRTIDATIQRFIAWRKAAGLSPKTSPTFNIWYSERDPVNSADYSMDLCVGIKAGYAIEPNEDGVKAREIPVGRCAVLRVTGDTHNLEPAALFLYRDWLPASGEEMRDFPIYCQRLFLNQPELGTAAELFLPLR